AEDGIRDFHVTGVQTCALPICGQPPPSTVAAFPEAGYLVVRDQWKPPQVPGREFHMVLKCGFRSHYHRHDDDFNIVLACREDWRSEERRVGKEGGCGRSAEQWK